MKKRTSKKEFPATGAEEKAFRRSDGYYFRGKKLQPFGFVRQSAMLALGAETGATELDEVANMLFLLSQPDSVAHRVRRKPADYVNDVAKFAEQNGITLAGKGFSQAQQVYAAVIEDLTNSTAKPEHAGDGDEEADDPN